MFHCSFDFNWIKPDTFDNFPLIKRMVEKNNYKYSTVHLLMNEERKVICVAIISKTIGRIKIEAFEVLEKCRHNGIGSTMLNYLKDLSQIIELHSVKEVEDFYIKNGFVKTKEPSTFLWIKV